MNTSAPLAVGGNRLIWRQLPAAVRDAVETAVGSPVEAARSQSGGFSPGLASVLTLADGGTVFAKAIAASRNPDSAAAHRREAEVLAALPVEVPAPRLRWAHDDGEWVVLVTDAVDGHTPVQPWLPAELDRFLAATDTLAGHLTPSPIAAPSITEHWGDGWRTLTGDPDRSARLDPWTGAHLDRLAALEDPWTTAAAGTSLLHGDLRADNLLLTSDGFVAVDWPSACVGAPWMDLLLALPSIAMHGGGDPQDLWLRTGLGRGADPDAVNAVLAAVAGMFTSRSLGPTIPLLPTIRPFQKAQGDVALAWLRRRLDW